MIKIYATLVDRFKAAYMPVEELVNDYLFEMEVVPHMSNSGFYAYSQLGKYAIGQMGGTNTYCDRGVQDAQALTAWLQLINQEIDSEFTEHIIIALTCFIMQAFERRFKCQLTVDEESFIITLPDTGRQISHLDDANLASIYRDQLMRSRDYLLRQLMTRYLGHREVGSEAVSEDFIATVEYFYLSSAWLDKVAAMDDYIIAVNPSLLDSDQMRMLSHVVAGIISERLASADWVMTDAINYKPGSLPDKIVRAVREQVANPNQTAVFDLIKRLSVDFNPPSEVIGFEDSIFIDPADEEGVIRDRYKMVKDFGPAPSLGVSTMWSKS